jgi:hypothetical protein
VQPADQGCRYMAVLGVIIVLVEALKGQHETGEKKQNIALRGNEFAETNENARR